MRIFSPVLRSLASRANRLVDQTAARHPGMPEVAAMVYVGDIYSLREEQSPSGREARTRAREVPVERGR